MSQKKQPNMFHTMRDELQNALQLFCQKVRTLLNQRFSLVLLAGAGAMTSLALPPLYLFPLSILGFMVLGLWLQMRPERLLVGITVFLFARLLCALYWIALAPAVFLGPAGYPMGVVFIVVMVGAYALQHMVVFLPLLLFRTPGARHFMFFLLLGVATYLCDRVLLPHLPWGMPALEWAGVPILANSVAVIGAHGLNIIVLMVAGLVSYALVYFRMRLPLIAAFCLVLGVSICGSWNLFQEQESTETLNVRVVQPNIPIAYFREPLSEPTILETLFRLSKRDRVRATDLLVWPESILPYVVVEPDFFQALQQRLGNESALILGQAEYGHEDGESSPADRKFFNSMHLIDREGVVVDTYRKRHLVPYGEYLPLRPFFSKIATIFPFLNTALNLFPNYTPGTKLNRFQHDTLPEMAALICFEVIFANEVVAFSPRPKLMVNITEDGWFGYSSGPYQHIQHVRLRAIEQGIPIIRSANSGISTVIDAFGRELGRLPLHSAGYIDARIFLDQRIDTPYVKYGDRVMFLFMILIFTSVSVMAFYESRSLK